jgi:hypothetical protein
VNGTVVAGFVKLVKTTLKASFAEELITFPIASLAVAMTEKAVPARTRLTDSANVEFAGDADPGTMSTLFTVPWMGTPLNSLVVGIT